jgi:hypothetical protein
VTLPALSDVIYNVLEEKLPTISTMISNVSKSIDRSRIYLFDINTKLYIAKDDVPVNGWLIRGRFLPVRGHHPNVLRLLYFLH